MGKIHCWGGERKTAIDYKVHRRAAASTLTIAYRTPKRLYKRLYTNPHIARAARICAGATAGAQE